MVRTIPLDSINGGEQSDLSRTPVNDATQQLSSHKPKQGTTLAVALSGGLDSAVTTLLLKQLGHKVVALHMIISPDDLPEPGKHIKHLATRLGVALQVVDLRRSDAFRLGATRK